jgi:hypothetical protein
MKGFKGTAIARVLAITNKARSAYSASLRKIMFFSRTPTGRASSASRARDCL